VVNSFTRCVRGSFPFAWFAYDRAATVPREWHGTLPEDKADEAGTLYRRARYYEPTTGRFTQEDPIGLAGGLNLYGFAGGDPVNFADPFGLFACPPDCGFEGDPRNLEREARMVQSRSGRDVAVMAGAVGAATVGAFGVMGATASLMLRTAQLATVAGTAVSAKDAIARGLVQAGGNLARLLPEIEAQAARLNPQSANDALGAVARATQSVGLEVGKITPLANGTISILSRGGVTTTLGTNGSILIERGKDVLLNIPR
jgi:RHS repeat-associated protein